MAERSKVFMAKLDRWVKEQPQKIDGFARQVCFEISERVVDKTPVDTGFLRGSWQPSIGEPSTDHQGSEDKAEDAKSSKAVAAVSLLIPQMKAGDHFYMVNNANYARFLEYGTSKIAPRYYVTDTVKQWQAICNKVAQELGLKK